ncbi:MAG TPA: replication-relaxation family protein [Thermoanaerobaculia bacterium]
MASAKRLPRFRRVKPRAFVITARDREVLELVNENRLLTSAQIAALLGETSPHLLRRLQLLYHARFLDRPRTQIEDLVRNPGSRPMIYALGTAGAELLGVNPPKVPKLQYLEHAVTVSAVIVALTLSCRERGNVRVITWREILEEKVPEETKRKRSPDTWQVRLPGAGALGVTPDAIFGLHYLDKPEGANRAYFFLEVDRGTMPVVRRSLKETSVYRKLLAYHATAVGEIHTRHFGFKSFRVLTVTKSPEKKRLKSMVEAAGMLPGLQGIFLFIDEASLLAEDALGQEWVNGRGERQLL